MCLSRVSRVWASNQRWNANLPKDKREALPKQSMHNVHIVYLLMIQIIHVLLNRLLVEVQRLNKLRSNCQTTSRQEGATRQDGLHWMILKSHKRIKLWPNLTLKWWTRTSADGFWADRRFAASESEQPRCIPSSNAKLLDRNNRSKIDALPICLAFDAEMKFFFTWHQRPAYLRTVLRTVKRFWSYFRLDH